MAIEEILARSAQVIVALLGAYLLVLYFVSIVWAYRDIESRSRSVVTQIFSTLLVVLFPFLGIPLYLVLRPKDTLDQAFQKSLEEEYLLQDLEELPLCPSCQHFVSEDFVLCPHCHTQLRDKCVSCDKLVDLRWSLCPYCGTAQGGQTDVERIEAPAARWSRPTRPAIVTPERAAMADRQVGSSTVGELVSRRRAAAATEPGKLTVVGGRSYRAGVDGESEDGQPRRGRFLRPTTAADSATGNPDQETVTMRADGD